MLFIADFAFRAYQSVRLLYYYWGRGALKVPDIDVTADQEPANPLKMSTPRLTALVLSSPATPAMLFMIFTIWGGALMSSIYVPLYEEYLGGCVNDGVNGTFVTGNIYSIAYNFASQDGNEATFSGLDNYDVSRGDTCSTYGTSTVNSQNEDEAILASLKATHAETATKNLNIATCVDATALDNNFEAACCGQTGYVGRSLARSEAMSRSNTRRGNHKHLEHSKMRTSGARDNNFSMLVASLLLAQLALKQRRTNAASIKINVTGTFCRRTNRIAHFHSPR